MSEQSYWSPSPPLYRVEWERIEHEFPVVKQLANCPQDSVHHAEGDVLIHTQMVVEALVAMSKWRALSQPEREIVFTAALLHDVAKPACTRIEDGRITSRGHSRRGALMARSLLWSVGMPMKMREQVVNVIRHHQVPFFLIDKPASQRTLFEVSQRARCDLLALVTDADARGRTC